MLDGTYLDNLLEPSRKMQANLDAVTRHVNQFRNYRDRVDKAARRMIEAQRVSTDYINRTSIKSALSARMLEPASVAREIVARASLNKIVARIDQSIAGPPMRRNIRQIVAPSEYTEESSPTTKTDPKDEKIFALKRQVARLKEELETVKESRADDAEERLRDVVAKSDWNRYGGTLDF